MTKDIEWDNYLLYNKETGDLIWKEKVVTNWRHKTWNTKFSGKIAGSLDDKGYLRIKMLKSRFFAHRIIWKMCNGPIPEGMLIDHINGNKADNRLENLRLVTNQQNCFNTSAKGYTWHKTNGKWQAQITVNGKHKNLGYFSTEKEARDAYLKAKEQLHGVEFIRTKEEITNE